MSRLLNRLGLAFIVLMTGNAWALGLGEIKLNSALNEPLRAEIQLLSATPEEMAALTVTLASAETFERYGLDRPAYLQGLRFEIIPSPRPDGSVVRVSSRQPMTEPFLTFLVEAAWSRGRLLREYTVLLDPPTFAPPEPAREAVAAPERTQPRDSGRIEPPPRQSTRPEERPAPAAPAQRPAPVAQPAPARAPVSVDTSAGGDYVVSRNETLWGIARSVRPDSQLTMNQTMLAIYEANPDAFAGNINLLKAGARLRIPSADEFYRIDRATALDEVKRQHDNWDGSAATSSTPELPAAEPAPVEPEPAQEPSLTLVPPDEEPVGVATGDDEGVGEAPQTRAQELLERLEQLEAADVPEQPSLIDIRNNEIAALRDELSRMGVAVPEPPVAEEPVDTDPFVDETDGAVDDGEILVDTQAEEPADEPVIDEPEDAVEEPAPTNVIRSAPEEPGLLDRAIDALTSFWMIIVGALVAVAGILFWFFKRRSDAGESSGVWEPLDAGDDFDSLERTSQTETIPAPDGDDDAFVVVEQGHTETSGNIGDTIEVPAPASEDTVESPQIEDTFSSETAVNLDQSDPIAEADFHMAYGLYDQAADLVKGALDVEPERQDLLTKLCEIYFVWGIRDSFVDAAERVKAVTGDTDSGEWNKIVIMGQQIAADHPLFADAGVAGATKEVDLTFEDGGDDAGGDLDMVFGDDDSDADSDDDGGLDFMFDGTDASEIDEELEATAESPTVESSLDDERTAEMPAMDEGTAEMPALDEALGDAIADSGKSSDETAEIDLDDLGLDLGDLDDDSSEDDEMSITGTQQELADTGINEMLPDLDAETGKNPAVDPNATGLSETLKDDAETDTDFDVDILAATGKTQVLSDDMAVETINQPGIDDDAETLLASNFGEGEDDDDSDTEVLSDDDATMLASSPSEEDFDFAKTEALPADAFDPDATAETPALASTDMDLDLDDLTAVLEATEEGDTVEMPGDEATVEQPRPPVDDPTAEVPTMAFGEDDMSDDLSEARTMTEVGTKLDLARAYVDMGDPGGARSILEEVLDEGDDEQRQQAQQLLDSLPT